MSQKSRGDGSAEDPDRCSGRLSGHSRGRSPSQPRTRWTGSRLRHLSRNTFHELYPGFGAQWGHLGCSKNSGTQVVPHTDSIRMCGVTAGWL